MLPVLTPGLIRRLSQKKAVVFHCALSQQRGPTAALKYTREREGILAEDRAKAAHTAAETKEEAQATAGRTVARSQEDEDTAARRDGGLTDNQEAAARQEQSGSLRDDQVVYVLEQGFVGWQEQYGEDANLTEGYRREIWKDGYWM